MGRDHLSFAIAVLVLLAGIALVKPVMNIGEQDVPHSKSKAQETV